MKLNGIVLTGVLSLLSIQAHAVVIIDNLTPGLYNDGLGDIHTIDGAGGFFPGPGVSEGDPDITLLADPGLNFALFPNFGNDWLNGDYSGGTWSAGPVAIPTTWTVNDDTAIVYDFNLAMASDLHIDTGVDNGIIIWLDGVFLFGRTEPGGANINEYDIDISGVAAGAHSLQILRGDHGGGTGYAISVDATDAPVEPPVAGVPEPGTLILLLIAITCFSLIRTRQIGMRDRGEALL